MEVGGGLNWLEVVSIDGLGFVRPGLQSQPQPRAAIVCISAVIDNVSKHVYTHYLNKIKTF